MAVEKLDETTQKRIDKVNREFAAAGRIDVGIKAAARDAWVGETGVRQALFNLLALDLTSLGYSPDELCDEVRRVDWHNERPRARGRGDDLDD